MDEDLQRIKKLYLDVIGDNCYQVSQILDKEKPNNHDVETVYQLIDQAYRVVEHLGHDQELIYTTGQISIALLTLINYQTRSGNDDLVHHNIDKSSLDEKRIISNCIELTEVYNDVAALYNFVMFWISELTNNDIIDPEDANTLVDDLNERYFDKVSEGQPLFTVDFDEIAFEGSDMNGK